MSVMDFQKNLDRGVGGFILDFWGVSRVSPIQLYLGFFEFF